MLYSTASRNRAIRPRSRRIHSSPTSWNHRAALLIYQVGAFAIVLAALPYRTFDLERHAVPKELVLHVAAGLIALLCLIRVKGLSFSRLDLSLAGYLGLSVLSALFAENWWLSLRSLGISLSGAALFWSARALRNAGLERPLVVALAGAIVLGALTALLQAYGLGSSLASLSRAPGGTFGNRNFMAHLMGIGLPLIVLCAFEARGRFQSNAWTASLALVTAALVLSRSRAAWLGGAVGLLFLAGSGGLLAGLWRDPLIRRRTAWLAGASALGIALALLLPNALDWRSDSPYLDTLRGVANYKEGSGHGRLVQYGNTLSLTLAHPVLGVGPGNWAVEYPRFASRNDPSLDHDDGMTANPWPSSDWMAFASERGVPAFLLLTAVMAGLLFSKWRWWDPDPVRSRDLGALAAIAAVLIAVVEGAFDAVLLLPTPTFFVWGLAGALTSGGRVRRRIELNPARRRWLMAGVLVGSLGLSVRNSLQISAMSAYSRGWSQRSLEHASRLDPGSYRIHVMLAESYVRHGRCREGREHAEAARRLFPNAPEPRRLARACGARE